STGSARCGRPMRASYRHRVSTRSPYWRRTWASAGSSPPAWSSTRPWPRSPRGSVLPRDGSRPRGRGACWRAAPATRTCTRRSGWRGCRSPSASTRGRGCAPPSRTSGRASRPRRRTGPERTPPSRGRPTGPRSLAERGDRLLVTARGRRGVGAVHQVQHARGERLGAQQLQRERRLALVEQAHTLAYGDGVDQQAQLVEEARGQQLPDDGDGAAERDVTARLVLQRGRDLRDVALGLLGVPPRQLQRTVREHDLPHVAELLGAARVLAAGGLPPGPGAGEAVVGRVAEEHDLRAAET